MWFQGNSCRAWLTEVWSEGNTKVQAALAREEATTPPEQLARMAIHIGMGAWFMMVWKGSGLHGQSLGGGLASRCVE